MKVARAEDVGLAVEDWVVSLIRAGNGIGPKMIGKRGCPDHEGLIELECFGEVMYVGVPEEEVILVSRCEAPNFSM